MMVLCDYSFGRSNGDYVLTLTPADASESLPTEPPPACRSKQLDPFKAQTEIMRRFLEHDMGGYRIVTDEDFYREEQMRSEQNGLKPARRLDAE